MCIGELFQRLQTALHLAAEKGNVEAVQALLDKDADITLKDKVSIFYMHY